MVGYLGTAIDGGDGDSLGPDDCEGEISRLEKHVADLQSSMFINCVYCGHRYGPRETTAAVIPGATPTMAEALTTHIATCPKHPMKSLADQLAAVTAERDEAVKLLRRYHGFGRDILIDGDAGRFLARLDAKAAP